MSTYMDCFTKNDKTYMKKFVNTLVGLVVAMMSTVVTVMGIAWIQGDCQDIFKFFGVVMVIAGIYGLAHNFIKVNEGAYVEQ